MKFIICKQSESLGEQQAGKDRSPRGKEEAAGLTAGQPRMSVELCTDYVKSICDSVNRSTSHQT